MFRTRFANKLQVPSAEESLPGREAEMPVPATHFVNGAALKPPWPDGTETAIFGMGCFWGAERVRERARLQTSAILAAGHAGAAAAAPMAAVAPEGPLGDVYAGAA